MDEPLLWAARTDVPDLIPGQVHIWSVPLDSDREPELRPTLSEDERERADRFRMEFLRRRFTICRGTLRAILGQCLQCEPADVTFQYGGKGKPSLGVGNGAGDPPLIFNVSHSEELALIAVSLGMELGVDVELVRTRSSFIDLARRFFATPEIETIESLPQHQQLLAFFHGWTRKEAILKAVGTGLTFPLNKVLVTMAPSDPCRLIQFGEGERDDYWDLTHLQPGGGYVGALATARRPSDIALWSWSSPSGPAKDLLS